MVRKIIDKKLLIKDCLKTQHPFVAMKELQNNRFKIRIRSKDGIAYYVILISKVNLELKYRMSEYVLSAEFEMKRTWNF